MDAVFPADSANCGTAASPDHQRTELAKAAVDLVVTQLNQFESGILETSRQILVPPKWVEGPGV